eukprot:1145721-Pelagomonas_calceolata.AAC.1
MPMPSRTCSRKEKCPSNGPRCMEVINAIIEYNIISQSIFPPAPWVVLALSESMKSCLENFQGWGRCSSGLPCRQQR